MGCACSREEGTPQGGPLSPLLANLLLDDLDKELEKRGHQFCRYADDCNIYVQSQAAGERVLSSVTRFLEGQLRLRVNRQKSAVAAGDGTQVPGPPSSAGRATRHRAAVVGTARRGRLRQITRRNRGVSFEQIIAELNEFLVGWVAYFRHAEGRADLHRLDGWIRRRLRCFRLKACKRVKAIVDFLHRLGVPTWRAWIGALSGKGWWRLAASPPASEGMSLAWFDSLGLQSLVRRYEQLNR